MLLILPLLLICAEARFLDDFSKPKPIPTNFTDWDYIVYSQRWPVTDCIDWQQRNTSNTCTLPKNKNQWAVHGVWPTKRGADGPFFCDSAIKFDPTLLDPILNDLNERWTNVEANTKKYSFWKHEWDKHGTCASSSPLLNSVPNYFNQGLKWNSQYDLATLLAKSNILPNNQGYTIDNIYNSLKTTLGKSPIVQCNVEGAEKQSLISEIRICFDKEFNLIDCEQNDRNGVILSNCSGKKMVLYLSTVPPQPTTTTTESYIEENDEQFSNDNYDSFEDKLVKLLNSLRLLIWLTT